LSRYLGGRMKKTFLFLCFFLVSIFSFAIKSDENTFDEELKSIRMVYSPPMEIKKQTLEGMILDEEGYAIADAMLEVKQDGKVQRIQSDKYGKFEISVDYGLLSIFVQKEGFLEGGEIVYFRERQPIKNLQIILKKRYSYIKGIVTDGIKALSGVTIRLRNENLETIDQVFSDSLGYYQFRNIGNNQKVAVSVYEEGFQEYLSDFFFIDKNYEKEHIILRKKEKNML